MRASHCHHAIKQSSASPNSLQLSSAGTRHSHYNKTVSLNVALVHRRAKTTAMRRLTGRPDSGEMRVCWNNSCRGLWLKKAADVKLNCGRMIRRATINPLSSCYVILKLHPPKSVPIHLVSASLGVWTGEAF